MQRYNITELSSKTLEELQEIAREIGFSPDAFPEKRELIYEILDQQAVTVAETTSVKRKPGRPRKSSSALEGRPRLRFWLLYLGVVLRGFGGVISGSRRGSGGRLGRFMGRLFGRRGLARATRLALDTRLSATVTACWSRIS